MFLVCRPLFGCRVLFADCTSCLLRAVCELMAVAGVCCVVWCLLCVVRRWLLFVVLCFWCGVFSLVVCRWLMSVVRSVLSADYCAFIVGRWL